MLKVRQNLLCTMKNVALKDNIQLLIHHNKCVVERKNKTIKEMARTMLNEAKLPDKFWKEVVHIALYILNRAQIRVRTAHTPYELWNGKITNVNFFK